jgi:hypothetical protein
LLAHSQLPYRPLLGIGHCPCIGLTRLTSKQDKFTTNFYLTDGSFGSLSNGSYQTPLGDEANLISGEYRKADGETGNIYDLDPADRPDVSDLLIPTPFTSLGVGSAIPGSMLGATAMPNSSSIASSTTTTGAASSATATTSTGPIPPLVTGMTSITLANTSSSLGTEATATSTWSTTGIIHNGTAATGGSAAATNGASMVTSFTSSPTICPPINTAAARFISSLPGILAAVLIAMTTL